MNIARDDDQALVLERQCPDAIWVCLALFVAAVILAGRALAGPLHSLDPLCGTAILLIGMVPMLLRPIKESLTVDRRLRSVAVLRKGLLGSVRREVRFEQIRAISVHSAGSAYRPLR